MEKIFKVYILYLTPLQAAGYYAVFLNGFPVYFHIVVGAASRYIPSQIMGRIKRWGARLIFKKHPYISGELWVANS
jgi:hypothetical protein